MPHRNSIIILFSSLAACSGGPDNQIGVYQQPPDLTIVSPPDESSFNEGEIITFEARVNDDSDPAEELLLVWSSDVDGELLSSGTASSDGIVEFATANLTPGYTHTISLRATDSDALENTFTVRITIIDLPDNPEIQVVRPAPSQTSDEGELFEFVAAVSDATDDSETLSVQFATDKAEGVFCTPQPTVTGEAACEYVLSPGTHELTFTVEDSDGNVGNATGIYFVRSALEIDDDGDGWTEAQGDCDDNNPEVRPGVEEVENGIDDDCNDLVDDGTNAYDDDGDGYSENDGDCDDSEIAINPDAVEVCGNNVDENCNSDLNEEDAIDCTVFYRDFDGDGYGSDVSRCLCEEEGYYSVENNEDCYDLKKEVNPSQSGYFTGHRGDTSYDYNCDGVESKLYPSSGRCDWVFFSCTSETIGWDGAVPECGTRKSYINASSCSACGLFWSDCCVDAPVNVAQSCR